MESIVVIGCPTCGRQYRYDTGRFGVSGVRLRCRGCEGIMRVDIPATLLPAAPVAAPASTAGAGAPITHEPEAQEPAAQEPAAHEAERQHWPLALVADGDERLRDLLASVLDVGGFRVAVVADGEEARQILAAQRPVVAFLNAFLPRVLGVSLCAQVKRHPELAGINIVLVGSQYRRDRFVRDPKHLYGADAFLDGSGPPEETRGRAAALVERLRQSLAVPAAAMVAGDEKEDLERLARTVVGDIILYNPETADGEIARDRFHTTFAAEIREGEAQAALRFPRLQGVLALYRETVEQAVSQYRVETGLPAGVISP